MIASKRYPNHFVQLVFVKAKANLQAEASRFYLSYVWWIFEPLLQIIVFYVVFGLLLERGTDNFIAYLLSGLIPWLWFNRSISNSAFSIVQGRGVMMQVNLPKLFFPTVVICQDVVKQFFVMILLVIFLLLYGIEPTPCWFALPLLMIVQLLFIVVAAYFVAAVIPFLPDLNYLVRTGLMMLMFCSGVFYSVEVIPEEYQGLFFLNPVASLLREYRAVLLNGQWPDSTFLTYLVVVCLVILLIEVRIMKRLEYIYPRIVI